MRTLKEMQNAGEMEDIANYYFTYNEEYNALVTVEGRAKSALFDVEHDPTGVDAGQRLALSSLIAGIQARMYKLDAKLLAFHAGTLSITPPSPTQIAKVKALSEAVTKKQVSSDSAESIWKSMVQIANITTKLQGA